MKHPRFARLAAVAGLLLALAVASAESLDEARTAFAEGRFVDAAGIAEAAGTSEGYALAARSLAVYGHYAAPEEEKKELFERALQLGEEAVRADTANPEGYFQSGHALGRYAQSIGTMTALRKGLGGKTRKMFEATLARDPDHALAHLALGGWNADIVSRAGRMMARVMYGATKKEAAAHFERALELAPESAGRAAGLCASGCRSSPAGRAGNGRGSCWRRRSSLAGGGCLRRVRPRTGGGGAEGAGWAGRPGDHPGMPRPRSRPSSRDNFAMAGFLADAAAGMLSSRCSSSDSEDCLGQSRLTATWLSS